MFFRIFNQPKIRSLNTAVIFIIVFCHIFMVNGCVTTSTVKYPRENIINSKNINKIEYIILNDGTKIDTKNKQILFIDTLNSIIIKNYELITENTNANYTDSIKTIKNINSKNKKATLVSSYGKNTVIQMKDILEFFIEKTETNTFNTTLFVTGVIAGVALTTILIKNATDNTDEPAVPPTPPPQPPPPPPPQSCPLIYSFDGEKYVFDSEPLSGVISEGMKRTDYTKLEKLKPSEGKFKILIKNQPGEKEMLDEIKMVSVSHSENTSVTTNAEGQFFTYKKIMKPESVTDENGKDITVFFKEKDDIRWQTQMTFDTSGRTVSDRHQLKFKFSKPEGAKRALIFANCGTAYWGSHMIKVFLDMKGDKVSEWYGSLFSSDKEMQKLLQYLVSEELFMMKVNLLEGDNYNTKTFIPGGGPLVYEDRVIRLPLEKVTGDHVEFILNPPAGFWNIDQIGIIYDYDMTGKDKIKEFDAVYAADQDGRNVLAKISNIDKDYYAMPDLGNYSNIEFGMPEGFDKSVNEIFLKTTGYYEIYTDKSKSEQTALIEDIMNTPGKIIEYSMALYKKDMKILSESINFRGNK